MRVKKVGGSRIRATISSLKQLGLGEEKKMSFREGEGMFYRLNIKSNPMNVAEIDVKNS